MDTPAGLFAAGGRLSLHPAEPVAVGDRFTTKQDATRAIARELSLTGRTAKSGRNGGGRQGVVMCTSCKTWIVRLTRGVDKTWKVSFANKEHVDCSGGGRQSTDMVQPMVDELVRTNGSVRATAVKRALDDAGFSISVRSVQRAKQTTLGRERKAATEAVARIPSAFSAITRDCPGSVAVVQSKEQDGSPVFKRSFLMLGAVANVAANSTSKAVAINSARLNGSWNGYMVILSMRDSNDNVLQVATVLASKECESNYQFIIEKACTNADMARVLTSPTTTVFVDEHKGSLAAIKRVIPEACVRRCVKHIITSSRMKSTGMMDDDVYQAARKPNASLCQEALATFKRLSPENYDVLMGYPAQEWANYANPRDSVILDQVSSNFEKSTISTISLQARAKDPFTLNMHCATEAAATLVRHSELSASTSEVFTPFAAKHIQNETRHSMRKHAIPQGHGIFIVKKDGDLRQANRVTLTLPEDESLPCEMDCTCDMPKRFLLPCSDVLAVLKVIDKMTWLPKFVDPGYKLERYRDLNAAAGFPVRLPMWHELTSSTLLLSAPGESRSGSSKKARVSNNVSPTPENADQTTPSNPDNSGRTTEAAPSNPPQQPLNAAQQPSNVAKPPLDAAQQPDPAAPSSSQEVSATAGAASSSSSSPGVAPTGDSTNAAPSSEAGASVNAPPS